MKTVLLSSIFTFLISTSTLAQINVGETAADFTYNSLENGELSLSDFEGKVVYMFFFGATCPLCQAGAPTIESDINKAYKSDTNFVALGVEVWNDPASAVRAFKENYGITFPLLLQAQQSTYDYYNSYSYDKSLIVGADQTLVYKGTGSADTDLSTIKNKIQEQLDLLSVSNENSPSEGLPKSIQLNQNHPNPFNPSTTITYQLSTPSNVRLEVFNLLGKVVVTLVNEFQLSGDQSVSWNASQAPSGIYIYRLTAGSEVITKKMLLIK